MSKRYIFRHCNALFYAVFLAQLLAFFFSCAGQPRVRDQGTRPEITGETPIAAEAPAEAEYLTIIAAGDNIIHDPILKASYKDGVYGFDSIYERIKAYITPADIAFVSQETILGNKEIAYSGYPLFSSPREAGSALAAAGFNVINHATNHAMDKGEAGILSSIEHWKLFDSSLHYLGIHGSEEERYPVIIDRNNIKVGFLAYTYGTNNIPLPADKPYLVSLAESETMAAEIDALRPLCDFLVVSMHWGEEYRQDFNKNQENLAAFLADHLVDLVIGHHPHVLEPFVTMARPDGGSMLVFYSLGNFLSAHARPSKEALLGGLMYVRLKKTGDEISAAEAGLIPVITHYEDDLSNFKIYPLAEYTEELAEKHWKRTNDKEMTADYFKKKARNLLTLTLF